MSLQIGAKTEDVGKEIQALIDDGFHDEIILSKEEEKEEWTITADSKKFWTYLKTPSEIKKMNKQLEDQQQVLQEMIHTLQNIPDCLSGHESIEELVTKAKKVVGNNKGE